MLYSYTCVCATTTTTAFHTPTHTHTHRVLCSRFVRHNVCNGGNNHDTDSRDGCCCSCCLSFVASCPLMNLHAIATTIAWKRCQNRWKWNSAWEWLGDRGGHNLSYMTVALTVGCGQLLVEMDAASLLGSISAYTFYSHPPPHSKCLYD